MTRAVSSLPIAACSRCGLDWHAFCGSSSGVSCSGRRPRHSSVGVAGSSRLFGAQVASTARVYPSCRVWAPWNLRLGEHSCLGPAVDCYSVDRVSLGRRATVSQYAFLCTATHDITDPRMPLMAKSIELMDGVWVCAGTFVGPGVTMHTALSRAPEPSLCGTSRPGP